MTERICDICGKSKREWLICDECKYEDMKEKIKLNNAEWKLKVEKLKKLKIVKDEFCQCGHSKTAHLPHQLDKNGGRCGICFNCDCYTWDKFEFVDLNPILEIFGEKSG